MATFILVHGTTFRKSSHWHWPILQDGLAETARAAGDEPVFEHLTWTGRNRARARQTAASELFKLVQRIQRASGNEKIFVIGHSHGGSAIAYFLKEHPEAAKSLAGCAFLSTPFVAIRPRKNAVRLLSLLLCFPFFAFLSLWNKIMKPQSDLPLDAPMGERFMDLIKQGPVYTFGIAIVAFAGWLYFKWASAPGTAEQSIRLQTADIPAGNYLFLRCSGDEAAAALSAAQFIAWLSIKVSIILELLTRPLVSERSIVQILSWTVLYAFVTQIVAYGWLDALPSVVKSAIGRFCLPDEPFLGKFNFGVWCSLVVVCILIFCLSVEFVVFFTQAVMSWAFGWTRLSTGLLTELAIEPLPFGEHSLVHIDWAGGPAGLDGIVHSWTYAHPAAILHLKNWVRASMGFSDRS
jgi:pimeloyl-ACP methyl ester carboxylesterase